MKFFLVKGLFGLSLVCSLLWSNYSNAQFTPYFHNYSLSEYKGGNQNWDIVRSDDGRLYVANNNGLLVYDGMMWNLHQLPNKTTVRSVLVDGDNIYTGSYEEFGVWTRNKMGRLNYHSISEELNLSEILNEEFWQILKYNDAIVFRSFLKVYLYKDGEIKSIRPKSTVLSCDIVNGELLVSTLRDGIFKLNNGELEEYWQAFGLNEAKIVSIANNNNRLFIATALHGCFVLENNRLSPWASEINEFLKEHQLNTFSISDNGKLIFGTIKNGIYATDAKGKILFNISKENGLLNNTVLGHHIDNSNYLWVGLDNGLASIDLDSKHLFYNDFTGKLGTVYDVLEFKDIIYIGSNTGLFYLEGEELKFIEGSQGQIWDLKIIDDQLLCGHNNGTFKVLNNKLRKISDYTGGWVLKNIPEDSNSYIQGTYAGLVRLNNVNGVWKAQHLGTTTMPIKFLVFEDKETAWAAHAYRGLYRIKFNQQVDSIISVVPYMERGLKSSYNVWVHKLNNQVIFKTNEGWQKYEPLLDSIIDYDLLNKSIGVNSFIISESEIEDIAIKNENEIIKFLPVNGGTHLGDIVLEDHYLKRLVVGFENVSIINDSYYSLNLNDGFMLIDKSHEHKIQNPVSPIIEEMLVGNLNKEINTSSVELPYNDRLVLRLTAPKSRNHHFEYAMIGKDTSNWTNLNGNKLELSNLSHGSYNLMFRTVSSIGQTSNPRNLSLTILPPWYEDTLGYLIYAFILILSLSILYLLHKRKMVKEQSMIQLKFEKEQEELLKEQELKNQQKIIKLKNEALRNEIKLKSKQLANSAMALVKKNETLLDLKSELISNRNRFDNYFLYKNILKRLDKSINHNDEWEIFEHNFNQVHEEFFNKIKSQHPDITSKELKICAYIKMNLTSKEIAPLLNISLRGVETIRYRLNRKLKLDNGLTLSKYLNTYK